METAAWSSSLLMGSIHTTQLASASPDTQLHDDAVPAGGLTTTHATAVSALAGHCPRPSSSVKERQTTCVLSTDLEDDAIDDGEAALDDEQPLPAAQVAQAIHVQQSRSQRSTNHLQSRLLHLVVSCNGSAACGAPMTCDLDSCAQTWHDPIGKSGLVLPQLRQEIHSIYGEQDSSRHAHWPAPIDVAFKRRDIWEALLHMADSIAALHWTPLTTPHIALNARGNRI